MKNLVIRALGSPLRALSVLKDPWEPSQISLE